MALIVKYLECMDRVAGCNLCGKIGKKRGFFVVSGQHLELHYCSNCDFYYLSPRIKMSREVIADFYDEKPDPTHLSVADEYIEEGKWEVSKRGYNDQLNYIEKYITPGKILDIGPGFGGFLHIAMKRGWDPYGVEISPVWAAKTDNLIGGRRRVFVGRLEDSNYDSNFFQMIHMRHLIEHLEDPTDFLKQTERILAPGGIVVIETPNSRALTNLTYRFFAKVRHLSRQYSTPVDPPFHLQGFSPKSLDKIMNISGFTKVLTKTTAHGDPVWRFKMENMSLKEFYGPHPFAMEKLNKLAAAIGRGDNILGIYRKKIPENN